MSGIRVANPGLAMMQGAQAAQTVNAARRERERANFFAQHGDALFGGDQNALNAFAQLDLMGALGVKDQLLQHQINEKRLATIDGGRGPTKAETYAANWQRLNGGRSKPASQSANAFSMGEVESSEPLGFAGSLAIGEQVTTGPAGAAMTFDAPQEPGGLAFGEPAPTPAPDPVEAARRELHQAYDWQAAGLIGAPQVAAAEGQYRLAMQAAEPPKTAKVSEAEQEIDRLMEVGLSRADAIALKENALRLDANPIDGSLRLIDLRTGEVRELEPVQPTAPEQARTPGEQPGEAPRLSFGPSFENAQDSFGAEGFARRAINTGVGAVTGQTPYPDVQQTQADFRVLRENLLNQVASAYNRQPPSWLMKEIRELIPASGQFWESADDAQAKLNALGRTLEGQLNVTNRSLGRRLKPADREALSQRRSELEIAVGSIREALGAFQQGGTIQGLQPGQSTTLNGVTIERID